MKASGSHCIISSFKYLDWSKQKTDRYLFCTSCVSRHVLRMESNHGTEGETRESISEILWNPWDKRRVPRGVVRVGE